MTSSSNLSQALQHTALDMPALELVAQPGSTTSTEESPQSGSSSSAPTLEIGSIDIGRLKSELEELARTTCLIRAQTEWSSSFVAKQIKALKEVEDAISKLQRWVKSAGRGLEGSSSK
jgi:hypothetical protein